MLVFILWLMATAFQVKALRVFGLFRASLPDKEKNIRHQI